MAEQTNLRQAEASVDVVGIVSEKKLELKNEEGMNKITGSLTVKTSDVNFVTFNVNVNEKTKAGADNKAYAGIVTVMNEYKSIAEVGEEAADRVRVSGNINPYRNKNSGEEVISYKANFFNRISTDKCEPKSEFAIEMYISSMVPEIVDDEETGRLIVNGWVPTYNGIEPVKLVAEADIAPDVESAYAVGQTVEFLGDIVNNKVVTVTEIPVAIGKPRKKISTTYKNDLVITGATPAYEEGVTKTAPYDANVIKAAIQERENKIREEQNKSQATSAPKANQRPSGAAHGRTLGF